MVNIIYNERLAEHGVLASPETVGDSFDNASAEHVDGSYRNETIHSRTWYDVVDVENNNIRVGIVAEAQPLMCNAQVSDTISLLNSPFSVSFLLSCPPRCVLLRLPPMR